MRQGRCRAITVIQTHGSIVEPTRHRHEDAPGGDMKERCKVGTTLGTVDRLGLRPSKLADLRATCRFQKMGCRP